MIGEFKHGEIEGEEIGVLPFTWRDVLQSFEVGDSRLFPVKDVAAVSTIRSHIVKYQAVTDRKFSTASEGSYIRITRIE